MVGGLAALQLLRRLLGNVRAHPDAPKYRSVRLNPKLSAVLALSPAALRVLYLIANDVAGDLAEAPRLDGLQILLLGGNALTGALPPPSHLRGLRSVQLHGGPKGDRERVTACQKEAACGGASAAAVLPERTAGTSRRAGAWRSDFVLWARHLAYLAPPPAALRAAQRRSGGADFCHAGRSARLAVGRRPLPVEGCCNNVMAFSFSVNYGYKGGQQ